ncbi:hypothetical protein MRY87_05135 [bacterium]|nr:hypothetical protein [bacterium]
MDDTTRDTSYSHTLLSTLLSTLQGKFSSYNILARNGLAPSTEENEQMQQEIATAEEWRRNTLAQTPLLRLSWDTPETSEAEAALALARRLSLELSELATRLEENLSKKQFNEISRNRLISLLAALARQNYTRESYLRYCAEFHKQQGHKDEAYRFRMELKTTAKDLEFIHSLITTTESTQSLSLDFYHTLFGEVIALPALFRSQSIEISALAYIYDGEMTYEQFGVPPQRAENWQQLGLSPLESAHWEAYNILPVDALLWLQHGVGESSAAGLWHCWRFPAQEAVKWHQAQFTPREAADWANAGFAPEESRQLISRGVSHPSLIKD